MAVVSEKYLIMVTLNNNNKFYKMIPSADGKSFDVIYGRVGNAGQKMNYPIKDFDRIYNQKIAKGYVDQTAIMNVCEEDTEELVLKPIENDSVRYIVEMLQKLAKQTVKTNYRISSNQVTPAMIEKAEELIKKLSFETEKIYFNKTLLELFEVIPRKMSNVISFTAKKDEDMAKIVQREQDLLDVMKGQVQTGAKIDKVNKEKVAPGSTILEVLGIEVQEITEEERKNIIKHLDPETRNRFKNAWAVRNHKTEANFNRYCEEKGIKETRFYYHGSRSENWWSIINNGLKLNPTNAVITGKMFGYGLYFAPKAKKSANYTSMRGAYWTGGTQTTGFMAVYKIAYGKPMDVHQHESRFSNFHEKDIAGYDCLHAHAGASLLNDEVIVYNENAATIRYIIELC